MTEGKSGVYACVDLGSNSFHLLVARWHDGDMKLLERCSERVQLGEGLNAERRISAAALERGLACLRRFRTLLARYPEAPCRAVGTNALRVADNAPEFLAKARELGFDVRVISGTEEARLIYEGVVLAVKAPVEGPHLVVDIGGGSTEIIIGDGKGQLGLNSLPVGCVTWRDRYFPFAGTHSLAFPGEELEERLARAESEAAGLFSSILPPLNTQKWNQAWASSGTAKMLRNVLREQGLAPGGITRRGLGELRPALQDWARHPSSTLPGLKEKRRELLLPGWCIMSAVLRAAELPEIQFSPTALREGLLYEMARDA